MGSVLVDGSGRLVRFAEKQDPFHAPYVNAGIYMMSRQMLYEIPPGLEVSLERELLPRWLRQGKDIKGFVCLGRCIDIGTPERYRSAQDILANVEVDAGAPAMRGSIMKVMITGAAGFIGGFLAKHCLEAGCSVLGLGISEPADAWAGGAFEHCDIRDATRLSHLISTFRPDRIFHLAAQSYPTVSLAQPRETIDINVGGTVNLFECLRTAGILPVVVVACSSAEYGPVASQRLACPGGSSASSVASLWRQ